MVGDGDSTEDITLPLVFLFSREGAVLTSALEEHRNVDVLLLPKERQLGHGEDQKEADLKGEAGHLVCFCCYKKVAMQWIELSFCMQDAHLGFKHFILSRFRGEGETCWEVLFVKNGQMTGMPNDVF